MQYTHNTKNVIPLTLISTIRRGLTSLLCLLLSALVSASDLNPRTPQTFFSDGAYVVSAPFRLKQKSAWLALGALGVTVSSSLLDPRFRAHYIEGRNSSVSNSWRMFSDVVQVLGPTIGTGLYIEGVRKDNDHSKETGYDSGSALSFVQHPV